MKKIIPDITPPKTLSKPSNLGKPIAPTKLPVVTSGSPQTPEEHMARRKLAGLTNQAVGDEFGVSKSTAHRKTTDNAKISTTKAVARRPRASALSRGFVKLGDAG